MRQSAWLARSAMILMVVAVLALAAGYLRSFPPMAAQGADAASTEALVGKAAPDFTLKTVDGKQVTLSKHKGSVVVLDFWATWCPPCKASLPHVQSLSADKNRAGKGLHVLAVNAQETAERISAFLTQNKYTFAVPMDSAGSAMKSYLVDGIPTTVVIGRDGVVRRVFIGYDEETAKAIDAAVDKTLAEEAGK